MFRVWSFRGLLWIQSFTASRFRALAAPGFGLKVFWGPGSLRTWHKLLTLWRATSWGKRSHEEMI